jgi:hypothetical protein
MSFEELNISYFVKIPAINTMWVMLNGHVRRENFGMEGEGGPKN